MLLSFLPQQICVSICASIVLFTVGCGGASSKASTPVSESNTPEPTSEPSKTITETAPPLCEVAAADESSDVVFSGENDWFLTVAKDSSVSCENERGFVAIEMAGINISVVAQPLSGEQSLEQDIQLVIKGYIEGISKNVAFDSPLSFEPKKIGEHGRQAFISDGRFELNGTVFHLLTSVTAVVNENNMGIFHVVFWRLEESDFEANKQVAMDTLETVSFSWFRLSDTDDEGNFLTVW